MRCTYDGKPSEIWPMRMRKWVATVMPTAFAAASMISHRASWVRRSSGTGDR